MSSGMPELGSKISLVSKADIRYEGRLFTVDPQECTIALASVRSFGTEDRETQYPVAPQSQVYDYILFRGSDIKDIRVVNNVPSLPNDPAIMQMSVPPSLGGGNPPGPFPGQFNHPVVGQNQYPQYHPMAGFPSGVHNQINKTSELSPQSSVELASQPQPVTAPIGSGVAHHANQVKDQGSMLDLIGGGAQQSNSRSGTPSVGGHRKSPTADQGTQQVGQASGSGQRRGSGGASKAPGAPARRPTSRNRQRYPSGSNQHPQQQQPHQQHPHQQHPHQQQPHPHQQHPHQQHPHQQHPHQQNAQQHQNHQGQNVAPYHQGGDFGQGYNNRGGQGGWRGRGRGGPGGGRGRGFVPRNKNTLKFENDYDFEQANTEFEELRNQLAKAKISEGDAKAEIDTNTVTEQDNAAFSTDLLNTNKQGEVDKKDDSGNETGAGEPEPDDDPYNGYDKTKSFFDNISCEAVERSKGRSQRTDWRTERKLNSETFGVASARRGAWRGRGGWRYTQHNPHHQPNHHGNNMSYFSWRGARGGRGRPQHNPASTGRPQPQPRHQPPPTQPAPPATAAAK